MHAHWLRRGSNDGFFWTWSWMFRLTHCKSVSFLKKHSLINVDWFVLFFSSFRDFLNNSQPGMEEVCSSRALATIYWATWCTTDTTPWILHIYISLIRMPSEDAHKFWLEKSRVSTASTEGCPSGWMHEDRDSLCTLKWKKCQRGIQY